jgi:hypothetical protein
MNLLVMIWIPREIPAIPTKFCENLDEKSLILADFSIMVHKSRKFTEILQILKFIFAKNLQKLNLERCKGLYIYLDLIDFEKC